MRKFKNKKKPLIIFLSVSVIFILFNIRYVSIPCSDVADINHDERKFEIHLIDVEQSESILLIQGKHAMLIDTGEMDCGKKVTNYLKSVGIEKLDAIVSTHFHKDHVGGFHKVISSFDTEKVICMNGKYADTITEKFWYADMQISRITSSMIHKHKIKLEFPYEKSGILKSFTLGNASVEILAQETHSDIINNKSIVMKVSYGDFSSLLMSDAQGEVEAALVEAQIDISADVLKVGHHGSKTSTGRDFLQKVNPQYAIISCGEDNKYGHPNSFVMKKLYKQGVEVHRTDVEGTIVIETDGNGKIEIITEGKWLGKEQAHNISALVFLYTLIIKDFYVSMR